MLPADGALRLVAINKDAPPDADIRVLKRVIHNWDDEQSVRKLDDLFKAAGLRLDRITETASPVQVIEA